jgi:hypothetical protein
MKFVENIGFLSGIMNKINRSADFHVLALIPEKQDKTQKNPSVTRFCKTNFLPRLQPLPEKLESRNVASRDFASSQEYHSPM